MAGYDCLPMKMKRKDIDRVYNDFSDFSLSSPARKIRRLLPPIMEEDETKSVPVNEERAIVLYKPLQHYHQPSSEHLFVDRDLISGFQNRFLHDAAVADDPYDDDDDDQKNKQQAVVSWDSSQFQSSEEPPAPEIIELDGEDAMMEEAAMDVEETSLPQQQLMGGLHQWQQQQLHCMIPQLPQTNSTPISWYR